jgi:hypothetical protein
MYLITFLLSIFAENTRDQTFFSVCVTIHEYGGESLGVCVAIHEYGGQFMRVCVAIFMNIVVSSYCVFA